MRLNKQDPKQTQTRPKIRLQGDVKETQKENEDSNYQTGKSPEKSPKAAILPEFSIQRGDNGD